MSEVAHFLYVAFVSGITLFQFCLIAGAPWGHLTLGGRYEGALPVQARLVAGFSVALLVFMALSMMSAAGLSPGWVALGLQGLSTLLNWITPSTPEGLLWGPVTSVMLLLTILIISGPPGFGPTDT